MNRNIVEIAKQILREAAPVAAAAAKKLNDMEKKVAAYKAKNPYKWNITNNAKKIENRVTKKIALRKQLDSLKSKTDESSKNQKSKIRDAIFQINQEIESIKDSQKRARKLVQQWAKNNK